MLGWKWAVLHIWTALTTITVLSYHIGPGLGTSFLISEVILHIHIHHWSIQLQICQHNYRFKYIKVLFNEFETCRRQIIKQTIQKGTILMKSLEICVLYHVIRQYINKSIWLLRLISLKKSLSDCSTGFNLYYIPA